MTEAAAKRVLPVADLREFFKDTLRGALQHQHLAVGDQTEHYVVNLLTLFARSEAIQSVRSGSIRRAVTSLTMSPLPTAKEESRAKLGLPVP